MPVQVTAIMLGVEDLARSKKFYGEGLGCAIEQDYPNFVKFNLGEGSSSLALYQREAAAQEAGVSVRRVRIPWRLVPLHRPLARGGGRDHEQGRGGRRRRRKGSGSRTVGWILRLLQRPRRLPLEGRVWLVI